MSFKIFGSKKYTQTTLRGFCDYQNKPMWSGRPYGIFIQYIQCFLLINSINIHFFCRFKISLKWYFKFPAIFGCKQKINNKDSQNQKQRHHVRKSLVLACPSQFLCKNEGKFIIYTVFVETRRETALIGENRRFLRSYKPCSQLF